MKKYILFFMAMAMALSSFAQPSRNIILDADTGNEVDDLYAVVRALLEPSWNILALNATQWQSSQWAVEETMENSHRLNQVLLAWLKKEDDVAAKRGGAGRMYDWGDQARYSAAAYEIIRQANKIPEGQKLTVIALGALTNVASALYIEPSIESKIELYWLGTSYDFEEGVLKRKDFNAVMDYQALELLLNSRVEMHVMPVNIAAEMIFDYYSAKEKLEGQHAITNLLLERWDRHLDGGRYERTIWDLALIEAVINPQLAEQVRITTSKDNGNKEIWYYNRIDADEMKDDFYHILEEAVKNL